MVFTPAIIPPETSLGERLYFIINHREMVLVKEAEYYRFPTDREVSALELDFEGSRFIGYWGDDSCYAVEHPADLLVEVVGTKKTSSRAIASAVELVKAMDERKAKIAEGLAAAERGQHEQELAEKRAKDYLHEAKQQFAATGEPARVEVRGLDGRERVCFPLRFLLDDQPITTLFR